MRYRQQTDTPTAVLLLLSLLLPLGVDFLHLHEHGRPETARVEIDFGLEDGPAHECGPRHIHEGRTLDIEACAVCLTSRSTALAPPSITVGSARSLDPRRAQHVSLSRERGFFRLSPPRAPPLSIV